MRSRRRSRSLWMGGLGGSASRRDDERDIVGRRYVVDVLDGGRCVGIENTDAVGDRGNPCPCAGSRKGKDKGSMGTGGGGVLFVDVSRESAARRERAVTVRSSSSPRA